MGTAENSLDQFNESVHAWFADAPAQVTTKLADLLATVQALRSEQVIYPAQENVLNAISLVRPEEVRVVILGQDPYHEPGQAMGLSFSVPRGTKLPPSLRNIYKELSADLECAMPESGDLTSWAEQGVLLLNTVLTVHEHKANSHKKMGWQTVTDYLLATCMRLPQPIVFLAWGRPSLSMIENAIKTTPDAANKHIMASTHPSPLSANRAAGALPSFMGSRPFSTANRILENADQPPICWESVGDKTFRPGDKTFRPGDKTFRPGDKTFRP